jgi:hypothetical protein
MDRVSQYQTLIEKVLTDYSRSGSYPSDIERQLNFDTVRHHYQIINVGWDGRRRVYGCIVHLDIKDGKIWIQYNGTEVDFAEELVALGVPRQDIVIGFLSPFMRQASDYAVG